jgi:mono/diheme cytochrome c family protein
MNRRDRAVSVCVERVSLQLLLMTLLVVGTVACSSSSTDGGPSSGQRLYLQNCALCHGSNGEGKPSLGATLQASEFVQGKSDAELVQFLIEGRPTDHPLNERISDR